MTFIVCVCSNRFLPLFYLFWVLTDWYYRTPELRDNVYVSVVCLFVCIAFCSTRCLFIFSSTTDWHCCHICMKIISVRYILSSEGRHKSSIILVTHWLTECGGKWKKKITQTENKKPSNWLQTHHERQYRIFVRLAKGWRGVGLLSLFRKQTVRGSTKREDYLTRSLVANRIQWEVEKFDRTNRK